MNQQGRIPPQDIVVMLVAKLGGPFAWVIGPGGANLDDSNILTALDLLRADLIDGMRARRAELAAQGPSVEAASADLLNVLKARGNGPPPIRRDGA
jgi:hypothetical protein